ncbi:hypothetical protein J7T55_001909 [Diaporthe amygdali]|uniref:uncharacterized protein n=1 Tax=Phomopsis amygdali TaxID=1214568 RepID=UPI0022FDE3CF|nr:uncharacterized protein J7T55_001909 [Diaporthe amygdali]KAJ0117709.1 hypothetical protein J7T55_001909 [Diaporthe amygdali]
MNLPTDLLQMFSYLHGYMRLAAGKTSLWRLWGKLISRFYGDDEAGKHLCPDMCFMSYRVGQLIAAPGFVLLPRLLRE